MAAKQYIDLADLALFKQLNDSATAQAIATAEARSLHTVAIDGNTLKFYREEEPVGSAVPAYSITLPQQDLSNYLQKIASATGSKIVLSKSDGTIEESAYGVADFVLDSELADVATSGAADDVSYDNTDSGLTATDVQAAIDELAEASSGGVASKTVYITETAGGSGDLYSKRYGIYQGDQGDPSSPVVGEKLADIDIPKDMVVSDGEVVDVVFVAADNTLHEGSASGTDVTAEIMGSVTPTEANAGKYIKLTIANASATHLWIPAKDLVDTYTAQQNASQVQLAIDNNNVISATIVAGSIGTTELANDSVTASKIDIAAHTESQTAGADGLAVSVTTTDGQVSAVTASIAANTYEPYGATSTAIAALDATESQTAGADGLALSITEVDGVITSISGSIAAGTYDAYGSASTVQSTLTGTSSDTSTDLTMYGLRAYADAQAGDSTESVPEADIRNLFSGSSV